MRIKKGLSVSVFTLAILVGFQNCSPVDTANMENQNGHLNLSPQSNQGQVQPPGQNTPAAPAQTNTPPSPNASSTPDTTGVNQPTCHHNSNEDEHSEHEPTGDTNDLGLVGGHFDLDTSHLVYAPSKGSTDHHVHEYDDKYDVTLADFFHLKDPKLANVNSLVAPSRRVLIVIANGELSPGARVEINGIETPVLEYTKLVDQFLTQGSGLTTYSLGNLPDTEQLLSLKIKFDKDVLLKGGLIGTETGCVRKNNPGAKGEYRNGALTIQVLDAQMAQLDSKTRVAKTNGGLLWEATLFNHWHQGCYQ